MNTEQHTSIINYLSGRMDEDERKLFSQKLEQDQELKRLLNFYQSVGETIDNEDKIRFLQNLENAEKKYFRKQKRIIRIGKKRFDSIFIAYAAALIIALFVASMLLFDTDKKMLPQELFAGYYAPYTEILEMRSENDQINFLNRGMLFYKDKKYGKAIQDFSKTIDKYEAIAGFYIALSYMELKNYPSAIQYFIKALTSDSEYKQEIQWYLSLAYLANNDLQQAVSLLDQISEDKGHYYSNKASELLDFLNGK